MQEQGIFPVFSVSEILVVKPEEKIFGDYSTNVAMVIAKQIKKNPLEIAKGSSENNFHRFCLMRAEYSYCDRAKY